MTFWPHYLIPWLSCESEGFQPCLSRAESKVTTLSGYNNTRDGQVYLTFHCFLPVHKNNAFPNKFYYLMICFGQSLIHCTNKHWIFLNFWEKKIKYLCSYHLQRMLSLISVCFALSLTVFETSTNLCLIEIFLILVHFPLSLTVSDISVNWIIVVMWPCGPCDLQICNI